ncbi:hypothetical protein [Aestuariirhabdus sp. LZHN29]|uniref:hypothetical protein n=1 Tax=Aestuariirhabdus sp. LZHN29 TaxID=3417462 RepID=UPI003CF9B656
MMGRSLLPRTLLLCALVTACSSGPQRALETPETILETNNETTMLFHSVLYYPSEISLNAPGFIVGVEKSPVRTITRGGDILVVDKHEAGLSQQQARSEIVDSKILYVSHIVENKGREFGLGNCTLHNAYRQPEDNTTQQLVAPCKGMQPVPISPHQAYKKSWAALEKLEARIRSRIKQSSAPGQTPFTHILVTTMGWNTVQEEAVRNFNSIIKNIRLAAGEDFHPLVIGVTWPSQWQSSWLGPLLKMVSFPVKARDADELGLTWLGVLLHDTLPKADSALPVVVIGHSFGSRASSIATCVGPAIHPEQGATISTQSFSQLTLINLQGAFQVDRLLGKGGDRKIIFPERCRNASSIYLTASKHDKAMDTAFWGVYAGNDKSYKKVCDVAPQLFNCLKADNRGLLNRRHLNGSHVTYINASDLIEQNAYLSGGGAHSDIYRREHGVLMWQLISASDD